MFKGNLNKIFFILFILFVFCSAYAETPHGQGFWHKIKWGETLIGIARKYDVDPGLLAKVNKVCDWNHIDVGYSLWIPSVTPLAEMIEVYIYTIRKGDTLLAIAQEFKVDMWEIAALNEIYNTNLIYENQKIYIPVVK